MKYILYLALIMLVVVLAILGLLVVFDSISQADAIYYGKRLAAAVLIISVASLAISGISRLSGKSSNSPQK